MNDHYFVNIFSFGIFTTTSQRTPDKRKHQIGKLAYLIEGVKEFRSVHGIPLQILADGKAFDLESLMALIFNGETAGGFHLAPARALRTACSTACCCKGATCSSRSYRCSVTCWAVGPRR